MRFSVMSSPRVRFSVECVFPHLGKRGASSRKSAVSNRHLWLPVIRNVTGSDAVTYPHYECKPSDSTSIDKSTHPLTILTTDGSLQTIEKGS